MGKEAAARLMTCENLLPTHTILLWRTFVERQRAEAVPPPSLRQRIWAFVAGSSAETPPTVVSDSNVEGSTSGVSNVEGSISGVSSVEGSTSGVSNVDGSTSGVSNVEGSTSGVEDVEETEDSADTLSLEDLPPDYIKTMIRVTITEVKFRLIADSTAHLPNSRSLNNPTPNNRSLNNPTPSGRQQDKVLCCLFLNNLSFTLQTGYEWWEVSCGVNNFALKDYSSNRNQLKYLIKRNDDYYTNDSHLYADKRDMIQIKLKYGQNLMIYGNINNLDVFVNLASILRIVSFFEMPSDTIRPPKQKSSQKEVPQLFIIMTYLYTVHPTLTISNVHVYVPADVN
ncbi:hypothetical protein WA577_000833, partial [Blastocystis sp. JDR]